MRGGEEDEIKLHVEVPGFPLKPPIPGESLVELKLTPVISLCRYLIEALQRSFLVSCHAPKNIDNASKETTPFNQIFGGYMRQDVTCMRCKHISTTFQHFMDILLDIRQVSNIEEALSQYFRQEKIGGAGDDGANMYKCEKCNVKVPARKRYLIERPPAVLCIQLKRFSLMGGKISKPVQLSRRIDVSQYVRSRSGSIQYNLVAMITHVGPSPNCGHYTAIGEAANGQFFQFDDSSVRPISVGQVLNTASYVVFYEMTRASWSSMTRASSGPETVTRPTPSPSVPNAAFGQSKCETAKPKVLTSAAKLGIVQAKSAVSSMVKSVTSIASTANGHFKKGLVPYEDNDSSDNSEAPSTPKPTQASSVNGTPRFVPRSVTVRALAEKTVNPAHQLNCDKQEIKASCSGVWTVTDADHHNPSVNSDNSTGSTTNGWIVKDKKSSNSGSSQESLSTDSLKGKTSNGVTVNENGRKQTTEIDVGAFAKTFLQDTPRKRANGSSSSRRDFDDYDADLDRGRTKKVRKSEGDGTGGTMFNSRSGYNPFQSAQNHNSKRRSDSSNGRFHHDGRNRSLGGHRDHNYHVDWPKRYNDNGRRKSFGGSDYRYHRNKGQSSFGRSSYRGGSDGYRQNENRDYYGKRHHKF